MVRAQIKTLAAEAFTLLALEKRVLAYVIKKGPVSTRRIHEAVGSQWGSLVWILDHLQQASKLDMVEGPRKAKLWVLR